MASHKPSDGLQGQAVALQHSLLHKAALSAKKLQVNIMITSGAGGARTHDRRIMSPLL
jgi:hypothetical protein